MAWTVLLHQGFVDSGLPEFKGDAKPCYDSMTGYRFTPWQWVESGTGWAKYAVRLTDAAFSSAWGWDLAVNGAGDKKEPLVIRSITVQKVPRNRP